MAALILATHTWAAGTGEQKTGEATVCRGGPPTIMEPAPDLEVFVDSTEELSLEDVISGGKHFEPLPHKVPSYGYTRAAVWLRFKVRSSSDETEDLIAELGSARPSHLAWHLVNAGRLERSVSNGSADLPRRAERLPMLALALPPGEERTVYLRVESDTAMLLPLRIGPAAAMRQEGLRKATVDALEIGFCLAISLLSLLLALVRRARLYLYLALISASYLLYFVIFHGYVTYMWPQAPLWVERQMQGIATGGGLLAFALFNKSFLTYPEKANSVRRWLERVSLGLPWIIIASFLLVEFRVAVRLIDPLAAIGILAGLALLLLRGRLRREEFWFAAAWGGLGFVIILLTLQFKDLVPLIIPIRSLHLLIVPSILTAFFIAVLMRQRESDAEEKQRWAERQAHELIENIPSGTYVATLTPRPDGGVDFAFRFASTRLLELFGVTRSAILWDPNIVVESIHPEDREHLHASNVRAYASGLPFHWEGRTLIDGEIRWLNIRSNPRRAADGATVWEGVVNDVTAQVEAERKLAETLENEKRLRAEADTLRGEAEKAHEAKSRFLAKMSHEIRTPLSALVSLSQAMWMRGEQQEPATEFTRFLNRVRSGGQYLNLLLRNVLNVSAAESGRVPVSASDFYVVDWIAEIRNILEPIADYHGGSIIWTLPDDDEARWRTDPMRLTQIALNLGENALKFSGGCDEPVSIAVRMAEGVLRLVVEDRGPGIRPDQMETVFAEYAQTGAEISAVEQGVGLGLAVVKINVELLGGSVRVQAREHRGTRFVVEIPRLAPPCGDASSFTKQFHS
jgi:PAS domain S-box-containing protein